MSKLLTFDSTMAPVSSSIEVCSPYFTDVRIINADSLDSSISGIYYGDEVNLLFWEQLNLDFGSDATYDTTYHLVSGYTYTYYVVNKEFIIKDPSNGVIFSNSNIKSIADFCVDFEVFSSHQLIINVSSFSYMFRFYKIAKLIRAPIPGIPSTTDGEIKHMVIGGDGDSSEPIPWTLKYLAYTDNFVIQKGTVTSLVARKYLLDSFVFDGFNYNKLYPNNDFYTDTYEFEKIAKLVDKQYISTMMMYSLLLPNLSKSIYPALQPINGTMDTNNNKPLYYPWLIWGIYEILINYKSGDDIDPSFEIIPFDLSPNWE